MSQTVKVLLIIAGSFVLLIVAGAGAGYWWLKKHGNEYAQEAKAVYEEGTRVGLTTDERGCYGRAIASLKTPEGNSFGGAVRNAVGFSACLRASKPVADFCDGVPAQTEFVATAAWEAKACAAAGVEGSYCPNTHTEMAKYCASPQRQAKLARISGASPGAK